MVPVMQDLKLAAELLPSAQAQAQPINTSVPVGTPLMHKGAVTQAPPSTSPVAAPTAAPHPSPNVSVAPMHKGVEPKTPASVSPFAAPTPAPHSSAGVGDTLVRKGMQASSGSWSEDTVLGSVVGAWAQQHHTSINRICLLLERDDEYLPDDVWECDLGALAKQWGRAFVVKLCVPSQDQVLLTPIWLFVTASVSTFVHCACATCAVRF